MRKQILQLIMLCSILAMPLATFGAVSNVVIDNLKYSIGNDEATVTGYVTAPDGALTIPATVVYGDDEYTVTGIGASASFTSGVFYNCTKLTSVEIPASITYIGSCAFYKCSNLASVTVKSSTPADVDDSAFYRISSSAVLYVPAGYVEAYKEDTNWASSFFSIVELEVADDDTESETVVDTTTVDDIIYTLDNNNKIATVTGYSGDKPTGALIIQGTVTDDNSDEYTVTAIADGGFTSGVFYNCTGLTSVEIPASITSIGSYTFVNCSSLTSVTFVGDSQLTTISDYAFYNCALSSIEIPASITSIGSNAFYSCDALASIEIPAKVSTIGERAFMGCSLLESVTFADDSELTTISDYAFYNCDALASIEIPAKVSTIGDGAFYDCSNLASVTVNRSTPATIEPNTFGIIDSAVLYVPAGSVDVYETANYWSSFTVKEIVLVFAYLTYSEPIDGKVSITGYNPDNVPTGDIKLPSTVTINEEVCTIIAIADNAFSECTELTSVIFNWNLELTTIGSNAFSGCTALSSMEIPTGVTEISQYAFSGCSALSSIEIPVGVTTISNSVFSDCKLLESVIFTEDSQVTTIKSSAFSGCLALSSIEIPAGVTTIDTYVFNECASLTAIDIPKGVTSIDEGAFYNCSKLASVTVNSSNPANIESNTFDGISDSAVLYVPASSVDAYKAANYWSEFFYYIYVDPSYGFDLPFTETFDNQISFDHWTVVDANNDGRTWTFDVNLKAKYNYHLYNTANDWLISPKINASDYIAVSFDYMTEDEVVEKFEVYNGFS